MLSMAQINAVLNRFDHSASKSATTHALPECDDPSGRIYQILNKLQYRLIPYLQNSMDLFDVQKDARRTLTVGMLCLRFENRYMKNPDRS